MPIKCRHRNIAFLLRSLHQKMNSCNGCLGRESQNRWIICGEVSFKSDPCIGVLKKSNIILSDSLLLCFRI